ncbi:MAG: rRNA pseudouridine synthase [Lachnospiraceae bacterium]|nr:rRNA pseudouridine synthase [Lachnospiraceae bacterium]
MWVFLLLSTMRLDKYICETAGLSRSEAKKAIKAGLVLVNGMKAVSPDDNIDETSDEISYKGTSLKYEQFVYFMLNKPAGVVSATIDREKTVIDLFSGENCKGLFPVGRLDKDTVGLLIVTNDGDLGHRLTSPKKKVSKKYLVKIITPLSRSDISRLETGLNIGNGEVSAPAIVEIVDESSIYLTVTEGKFHEVKRMLKAVDNEVTYLKRVSMGPIVLDPLLKEGEYRRLTPSELELL